MAEICNLESPAHQLVIGLDLLADLIGELDDCCVTEGDKEAYSRAWFAVHALKVIAARVSDGITREVDNLPQPYIAAVV